MGKKTHTREEIIQVLKEADAEGKQPSRAYLELKGINGYWIQKLIPEGLTELKQRLGLKISAQERPRSDDELLEELDNIVEKKGILTWSKIRTETGRTDKVYKQRFGKKGIREVYSHYRKWLEKNKPKSKNIELVDAYLNGQDKTKTPRSKQAERDASVIRSKWPKVPGKEVGAPLNFGNLIYAPTNEQGVVFLFGMVSRQLGFSIEHIGTEFPDCEAKRFIEGRKERQQTVKIEFEFRSRDFNHPLEGCNIIVCWEDNWRNECPLEVIELRTEIEKLRKSPEFRRE